MKKFNLKEYKNQRAAQSSPSQPFKGLEGGFVPDSFFDELENSIMLKTVHSGLHLGTEPANTPEPVKLPFLVSGNYFNELEQQIQLRINPVEMPEFSSAPVRVFTVPEGYFDNLLLQITERIQRRKTIWQETWAYITGPIPKYALAGSMAVALCFGYYYNSYTAETIASAPKNSDIVLYLENNMNSDGTDYESAEPAYTLTSPVSYLTADKAMSKLISNRRSEIEDDMLE